jgi:predicted RNA methylase
VNVSGASRLLRACGGGSLVLEKSRFCAYRFKDGGCSAVLTRTCLHSWCRRREPYDLSTEVHDRTLTDPNKVPEELVLGQFIPTHYHAVMLADEARTGGFKSALEVAVPPGGRVVELGGGTGVLSFFAAQKAQRVWCVERNPELVQVAQRLLVLNGVADRVELVEADAYDFLPPEPVDVVVCEMLHTGLLREKQVPVIASFKERYLARFGPPLPTFVPEACVLGLQPVEYGFTFSGYSAPIPVFQDPSISHPEVRELAAPVVTHSVIYEQALPDRIAWNGEMPITADGTISAIRFITRAILAVRVAQGDTIDWYLQHVLMPLETPVRVKAGGGVQISFSYAPGAQLAELAEHLRVTPC